jgi:RNA polymerase sigma-70 factor (ECF subfamily)
MTETAAPSPADETTLLARLQAGDEQAFEELVRMHGGRMLAVARRFVRNEDDARDVVQAAYLSAFRSISQFEGQCLISTWLHRIVVNTALMRLRSQRRKPETSIEDLLPVFQEDGHHVELFPDVSLRADEALVREEMLATVRACIQRLPDNYRDILILRDLENVSTSEVAALLSMTPTAVKVRLHRARQALSALLRREVVFA